MNDFADKMASRSKRVGRTATLFFAYAAVLACAAGVSWLAGGALGNHDTLLSAVPEQALFYEHDGQTSTYAVRDTDGALVWTTLDPASNAGAVMRASGSRSLADDATVARALHMLRGAFRTQLFVRPEFFDDATVRAQMTEGPVVVGLRRTLTGFWAAALPAARAAQNFPLGWSVTAQTAGATSSMPQVSSGDDPTGPGLVLPDASFVSRQAVSTTSFAAVLFDVPPTNPSPAAGASFDSALAIHGGDATLSIAGRVSSHRTILLHLPYEPKAEVEAAIARYASLAWPTRKALTTPDRDTAIEFVRDDGQRFGIPIDDPSMGDSLTYAPNSQIVVFSDNHGGSLISNTSLAPKRAVPMRRTPEISRHCPDIHFINELYTDYPQNILNSLSLAVPSLKFDKLVVMSGVDKTVLFCGYEVNNVDNISSENVR